MVWSDALLISLCPLIFPCCVCTLSWQAQASVLQPEGRNKQAPLGVWETAQKGRGELQNNRIKMRRRVREELSFGSKPELGAKVCYLWVEEMESKWNMFCFVFLFGECFTESGILYMHDTLAVQTAHTVYAYTYTFPEGTGTKNNYWDKLVGLLECTYKFRLNIRLELLRDSSQSDCYTHFSFYIHRLFITFLIISIYGGQTFSKNKYIWVQLIVFHVL